MSDSRGTPHGSFTVVVALIGDQGVSITKGVWESALATARRSMPKTPEKISGEKQLRGLMGSCKKAAFQALRCFNNALRRDRRKPLEINQLWIVLRSSQNIVYGRVNAVGRVVVYRMGEGPHMDSFLSAEGYITRDPPSFHSL